MNLKGWEIQLDGTAASGATVTAYVASGNNLVPPGAAVATTSTDGQGFWEITGLADVGHDVKVVFGNQVRWYKGLTRFSVQSIQGDNYTPANENLLKNGGFESWGANPLSLSTTPVLAAYVWSASITATDTGQIDRETTVISASKSRVSLKLTYVKNGAGPAKLEQIIPIEMGVQLRGQTVYLSAQIHQANANTVRAYLDDGITKTYSTNTATIGAWTTITVGPFVVSPTVLNMRIGFELSGSTTAYLDNVILALAAVAPVYAARTFDVFTVGTDELLPDSVTADKIADGAIPESSMARAYFLGDL